MSRVGQVWESEEEGIHLIVDDYPHPDPTKGGMQVLKVASLETGNVTFLAGYILKASEMMEDDPDAPVVWKRIA